jgi:hypothetical protein
VLHRYQLPNDPQYPQLCIDEQSCLPIEDGGARLSLSPGKAKQSITNTNGTARGACPWPVSRIQAFALPRAENAGPWRITPPLADVLAGHYPQVQVLRLV